MGFAYSATGNDFDVYWYEKNLHGDIVAVYSDAGIKLISYTYDAWGNATISYHNSGEETTAINNPFTYRGYYYDKELGILMVGQRYYSPELCRFIQPADASTLNPSNIEGLNLYSYASNNPIKISKSANRTYTTLLNGSTMTHIVPSLNKLASNVSNGSKNYWNPHWENKWFDTDRPGFLVLSPAETDEE